ncbi:MAG: DUF4012 domain-containing protein, partial [Chloroflexi bacterium]|nr:DUF4012 domain-containing protein [Chloroflexota bacterium]
MAYPQETRPIQTPEVEDSAPVPVTPNAAKVRVRRRRRRGPLRRLSHRLGIKIKPINLLIVLVSIVVVVAVGAGALIADAANQVQASLTQVNRAFSTLNAGSGTELTLTDFRRLQTSVNNLSRDLRRVQGQIGFVEPFVSLNPDLEATWIALGAARSLSAAAGSMLNGLQPTLNYLVSGGEDDRVVPQISSGERIVERLTTGLGQFQDASRHLEVARRQLDSLELGTLSASLLLTINEMETYYDLLDDINGILNDARDSLNAALGLEGERSYLILSQNSDELRPSGGYVSTYGWMLVRNGRISDYSYSATTASSPNPPPSVLADQVPIPEWWIPYSEPIFAAWDGSWYADFPSTAEMAMWYYNSGGNPQSPVDGVIAIDIVGFEYILGALGRVEVPGYDVVVTPQNFRQVIYDIRAFGEGDLPHKRFLAALYQQIFSDWQEFSADPETSNLLLGAVLQALQEKHLMLHFTDESLNNAVEILGWGGYQSPGTDHDYLMIADGNLGNKSNNSILRQLTYNVEIQLDGTLNSRTTIEYAYEERLAQADPAVNPEFHGPLDYNNLLQV